MIKNQCVNCGGDLEFNTEEGFTVCTFCGDTQLIPRTDDEEKVRMLNQADELRKKFQFDAAISMYSQIIAKYPDEEVAYYRLALSEFGIEYVLDTDGETYVPTFHRLSYESVLQNKNMQKAIENAGPLARAEYIKKAQQLEELRKKTFERMTDDDEKYDVFISFKQNVADSARSMLTTDYDYANGMYRDLTEAGYKVFFSPVTLQRVAGKDYEPYIFSALNSARIMILLSSRREYGDSQWVRNEWTRFLELEKSDNSRRLIPCYFRTPDTLPQELAPRQGFDMDSVHTKSNIFKVIERAIPRKKEEPRPVQQTGNSLYNEENMLNHIRTLMAEGEYEEAQSWCSRLLNHNPECAEVYMDHALIAQKVGSLSDMKAKLIGLFDERTEKQYTVSVEDSWIQEMIQKYQVPGYFNKSHILQLVPEPETYTGCLDSLNETYIKKMNPFFEDKEVQRAYKYAEGEYAQTLKTFEDQVCAEADRLIEEEDLLQYQKHKTAQTAIKRKKETTEQKLAGEKEQALNLRDQEYAFASSVNSEEQVDKARAFLAKMGNFKNAASRKEELDAVASVLSEIGDGSNYLCRCMEADQPGVMKDFVTESIMMNSKYKEGFLSRAFGILFICQQFIVLISVFSDLKVRTVFGLIVVLLAFLYAALAVRSGKKKPVNIFMLIILCVGNIIIANVSSIIAIAFAVLTFRPAGAGTYFLNKKIAGKALQNKKKIDFVEYERKKREELAEKWQHALGTSFDHPLSSINDTLAAAEKEGLVQWFQQTFPDYSEKSYRNDEKTGNTASSKQSARSENTDTGQKKTNSGKSGSKGWLGEVTDMFDNMIKTPAADSGNKTSEPVKKSRFDVELIEVGPNRVKVMKVISDMTGISLRDNKTLVDNVPSIVQKDLSIEDAEKTRAALEAVGAKVTLK